MADTNQTITSKIHDLESTLTTLQNEKKAHQQTVTHQQKEIEKITAMSSHLQEQLKEKEQKIHTLQDTDHLMNATLKELQSKIRDLEKETQARDIIISDLRKEIETTQDDTKDESTDLNTPFPAQETQDIEWPKILLGNKLVSEHMLQRALEFEKKYKGNILKFLFVNREINERSLVECVSSKCNVIYFPLVSFDIQDELIELFPSELAQEYWVLPVDRISNSLTVIMVDPFDKEAIEKIEKVTGYTVQTHLGLFSEIATKIQNIYKVNIQGLDAEGNRVSPLFINTEAYKGRERRRAVRFTKKFPLRAADEDHVILSSTENICWDGLSFKLDHQLKMYSTITIQVGTLESGDEKLGHLPLAVVAQVTRNTPHQDNSFMVGVKFIKTPKDDLSYIIDSISKKISEED